MTPQQLSAFRALERSSYIGRAYSGWVHLAVTAGGSLLCIGLLGHFLHSIRPLELVTLPVACFLANVAEYGVHRWPMHRPGKLLRAVYSWHTLKHHRFFTDSAMEIESARDLKVVLFPPFIVALFLLGIGLPIALAVGLLWSLNAGLLYAIASLAYFLVYELLHLGFHLPKNHPLAMGWMMRMGEKHRQHHVLSMMAKANFNVAFDWTDRLLGTSADAKADLEPVAVRRAHPESAEISRS